MPISRLAVRLPLSLALASIAGVMLTLFLSRTPEQNAIIPPCPVRRWTGFYCPGCGSARTVYALLHADVLTALRKNPLAVIALPFLIAAFLRCWWQWVRGGPFRDALVERWSLRIAPTVLILLAVYTVLRNIPGPDRWLAPH